MSKPLISEMIPDPISSPSSTEAAPAPPIIKKIPLGAVRLDGGTQARVEISRGTVHDYAEAIEAGEVFPPVVVYQDEDGTCWLSDGFHRYFAARQLAKLHRRDPAAEEIAAEIRQGTRRDALLNAISANVRHGLRRSNADKRRAVDLLLRDDEWSQWSDREIARRCGVSNTFVGEVWASLSTDDTYVPSRWGARTYRTRHGTVSTMDTTAIGKRTPKEHGLPEPPEGFWSDLAGAQTCLSRAERLVATSHPTLAGMVAELARTVGAEYERIVAEADALKLPPLLRAAVEAAVTAPQSEQQPESQAMVAEAGK